MTSPPEHRQLDLNNLVENIKDWSLELGFQQTAISDIDLSEHDKHLNVWLKKNFHGQMHYMEKHGSKRSHPEELVPGTLRAITVRMDYLPENQKSLEDINNEDKAYIAQYALGRDYHKVMRNRLQKLCNKINALIDGFEYRVFVDSAPVLERALAEKSGLGWIGKNTMLINRRAGSWFFLGEIYTNLPLPIDETTTHHCGSCSACLDICPTNAFEGPYKLDARKCISYLTIEHKGQIPIELRSAMGNRIYGCDDCQLVCPWNRYASASQESDFHPRHELDSSTLNELFSWSEDQFLKNTEGSAIRRIGYESWLRNIAIGLGNAPFSETVLSSLLLKKEIIENKVVNEHIDWAISQQLDKKSENPDINRII